ncbi:AraC family transcriptional regulator [Pseudomonas cavernae]|uniref:AraC family transcriptional regulator n=1 Tax=Pseudomonas cavernae TaxID=2320867 RepID=A0A385Z3Y3_9PSED|nr:AraC family transcriptional regulator [Pseudomonas cavernae]AYC33250.1 AraC family transcriptional regulator [Pseudomonas cavernae]
MKQPPRQPARRSATSVQLLTQFGLDHGLSAEHCLAGTGLNWQMLADPGAEVGSEQELQLIRNLVVALGHIPGIGLQAGMRYRLNTYGIWGFALLSSPNYRSAASIGLRYLDLTYAFTRIHLEESGDEAALFLDDSALPADLRSFILERDSAAIMNIHRDLTNTRLVLTQANFRIAAPSDPTPYLEWFGAAPSFNASNNCLVFPRPVLDLPLPGADPQVVQHCEQQCQRLLTKRRVRTGLARRIRDRLLARPGHLPDMESLASELHMTSRTLRRRLEEQGTSFRQLLEEVRQALAEELLATGLNLEEIAERLGYGEASNFTHAFKRWKGVSPRQYRRQ